MNAWPGWRTAWRWKRRPLRTTTAALLERVNRVVDVADRPREWPKNGRALGAHLRRQESRLAAIGFSWIGLERRASGGARLYALIPAGDAGVTGSDGVVTESDGTPAPSLPRHSLRHSPSPAPTCQHDITGPNSDGVTTNPVDLYSRTLSKERVKPSEGHQRDCDGTPRHSVTPSLGHEPTCWTCGGPLPPGTDDTAFAACRNCGTD